MLNRVIASTMLLMLFAGCSMIPEYKRPAAPVPANWPGASSAESSDKQTLASDIRWEEYFQSDALKKIIKRALENNRDLRVALLNVKKARATYRIQSIDRLPEVDVSTSGGRSGVPANLSSTGGYVSSSEYNLSVGITSYELDFYGRVESLNQEALESYFATEEALVNTRIALIAETADAYLTYLADIKLLRLAEKTYESQKKIYDLLKHKYDIGSTNQLDVAQAATSVESARVSMAQYTRQIAQARNALTLLTGADIVDIVDSGETIDNIGFLDRLPAGIPSEVLVARPDIMAAEHILKAANADIGAARAALYPSIKLTTSLGLASDALGSLFSSGSAFAWTFTPSLSIPIFNRDKLKASLEVAELNEKIAAAEYEKTIQSAFREVSDQLAARSTYRTQLDAQTALVDASAEAFRLSNVRYRNGIDNFLTVLDSQRALFAAEQGAVTVKQQYLSNLVTLYKVLGGGRL